ncbi:MAG: lamin tail domain-containing protein, partial [Bacteroidetes bacterium]|nr:lamin tail domain-containing protein [Bacteroidota bacterium]
MKKKLFSIYILLLVFSTELIHAQCLEVTSIFVNACQGQANEGDNEMFSFTVGASPLAIADITVNWGTSNSFDGWCFNSVSTAALNANISNNCGFFIEPISGILPANADVLVVTSEFFSLIDNDFSNLSDTLYILYQCGSTAPGHFSNSANNTLTVTTTNSCIGVESVSYLASSLVGGDGATVLYDAAGNGTYVNNGCNAPIVTFSVGWSFTNAICNTYGVVDLNNLLSGNATTGGTWSGPRVSGSTYNPNGYLGLDSITYSINGSGSCLASSDSTIVFNVVQTNTASYNTQSCDSVYYNGIWYTSSATFVDTISGTGYACDSFTNVTISIQNAIIDSTYLSSCTSLTFNGNTYSSSTILRDTITGGGGSSSSCSELFFSEYIEGSSNNKALEIYNGTGVPVNLANYSIERYTNGSTTASLPILTLSGTLADGDVYVIYNSLATNTTLLAQGDLATGYINHNGDDAYALVHNTTIVDVFGNIGCDPGNEWTDLGNGTQDNGYYRLPNYTAGANDPANTPCNIPSLIATNWVSTDALDDFSNIGSHNANCGSSSSSTCDSIFITNIDIASPATTNTITACTNNPALAGTVNDTIFNINGCDSIITTTITTLVTPSTLPVNLSGCGSVSYNSVNYTTSTSFSDTTLSSLGCDSVYTNVNIVVNQNASSLNPGNPFLICDTNDSIQLPGGAYAYGAGTFNFTIPNGAANGCDSTVTTIVQTQSCGCFFDDISKTFWIKADTLLQNAGL